ncbi:MAG: hypothetical protein ACRDNF_13490 [Streptosporangiaceae bacterium]
MSSEDTNLRRDLEVLRQDGSVLVRFTSADKAGEWRAAMRRACRTAGLRVRTGIVGDGQAVSAYHFDHVVTEADLRAAARAMDTALTGDKPSAPFHELVRQEQRKMLRAVPPPR